MRASDRVFHLYLIIVVGAGLATLAALVTSHSFDELTNNKGTFAVLAVCTILGEVRPVQVLPRRQTVNGGGSVTTSTTFAFALLLMMGPGPAALALVTASLIADILDRREWYKTLYNLGQYTLSVAAAGAVIAGLSGKSVLVTAGRFTADDVMALAAATFTLYFVNSLLIGAVVGLSQRAPLILTIIGELKSQAPVDALLLGMSPVVVVVAERNLALIPFLLLPVAAVYMSARASLEKEHQALHDALTGLPNRTLFREVVSESISRGDGARSAIMLIDLDRFKEINDTLGHHIGDLLLKEVGPRLREGLRDKDIVARLGGDEFAIFVEDADDAALAEAIAHRARSGLGDPFAVEDLALHVDGSIGIALFPEHGTDVDTLLQRADVAMYAAKEDHTGCQLYSAERDPYSLRRLTLLSELRGAIERGELVLHYQPKADLRSRCITDVEALVRWNHPSLGLVPPYEFVPLAERSGLIGPLTELVLRQAIGRAAEWQRAGQPLRVSVNLSVHNLMDAELPALVAEILTDEGLDPVYLALEITETTVMSDPVRAMRVLQPLSDMGVRLAIDDFGTGYSSLAYLRQLPITEIKIDRSFIANVTTSENDAIIVRSTIELARNLGLEIVAEGVETPDVCDLLAQMGCDYVQGYYLSRPLPAADLGDRLNELALTWAGRTGPLRVESS